MCEWISGAAWNFSFSKHKFRMQAKALASYFTLRCLFARFIWNLYENSILDKDKMALCFFNKIYWRWMNPRPTWIETGFKYTWRVARTFLSSVFFPHSLFLWGLQLVSITSSRVLLLSLSFQYFAFDSKFNLPTINFNGSRHRANYYENSSRTRSSCLAQHKQSLSSPNGGGSEKKSSKTHSSYSVDPMWCS